MINAHIVLIQELMGEDWWEGVTTPLLETVRKKLRALIKLIPKKADRGLHRLRG
jgi:type I restriction enzyme R subunit